jgi:hypothetical protein
MAGTLDTWTQSQHTHPVTKALLHSLEPVPPRWLELAVAYAVGVLKQLLRQQHPGIFHHLKKRTSTTRWGEGNRKGEKQGEVGEIVRRE